MRTLSLGLFALALFAASGSYRYHGKAALNDPSVTPGALSNIPQATLCNPAWHTTDIRNVPESEKHAVCAEYGIPREKCTGANYEIDHLVSLEIGGANDIKNLWPQPRAVPGAAEKDKLENYLHRQVCGNQISLKAAQQGIEKDWYALYLKMPQ